MNRWLWIAGSLLLAGCGGAPFELGAPSEGAPGDQSATAPTEDAGPDVVSPLPAVPDAGAACVPLDCTVAGCGVHVDPCSQGTVHCGTCQSTPEPTVDACVSTGCQQRCGYVSDGCSGTLNCGPCATPVVDAGPPPPPPTSDLGQPCGTSATPIYKCNAGEYCGGNSVYAMSCRACLPTHGACGQLISDDGYGGPLCCSGSTCGGGVCD